MKKQDSEYIYWPSLNKKLKILHPCSYYLGKEVKKNGVKCCGLLNHFPLGKPKLFKKCKKCEMYKENYNE